MATTQDPTTTNNVQEDTMTNNAVSHPAHYTAHPSGIELIELIEADRYTIGNIAKYIVRRNLKGNPIEDLRKARQYAEFELDRQTREIWAPYPRDDRYEVSTLGRVRFTKTGRIRKLVWTKRSYLTFQTRIDGKPFLHPVHRAVWETFVGPVPRGLNVCHGSGDERDNRLSNLRVDTPRGNSADKDDHGTTSRGETHGQAKLTADQVALIRSSDDTGVALAARFGVSRATITDIRKGRTWRPAPPTRAEKVRAYLSAEPEGYAKQALTLALVYPGPEDLAKIIDILDYMIEIEQEKLSA